MKTNDTYTEQLQNIKIYTYKNLKNIKEGKSPNTEDLLEAIAISTNKAYQTVVNDYLKLKELPYKEREGELLSISYTLKNNTKLEQKPKGFGMDLYHVTFYYLATGMDGIADEKDFGYIRANSEEDALEYVVMNEEKWRGDYPKGDAYRYWGLSAEKIEQERREQEKKFTCSFCGEKSLFPFPQYSFKKSLFGIRFVNDVCSEKCLDNKYNLE